MINRIHDSEKSRILRILEKDISNCLYMYIDIKNYNIESDRIQLYEVSDNTITTAVIMLYYDSYQIYALDKITENTIVNIAKFIENNPKSMISGQSHVIKKLDNYLSEYRSTFGAIFIVDNYRPVRDNGIIEEATVLDSEDIARLICSTQEIGIHYKIDNLAKQLSDRIITKTGRSYIIRNQGKIVAHTATYAECEDIAIVSGTIVDTDYRTSDYYMLISSYMAEQLRKEKKTIYTFSFSDRMIKYHERIHSKCGEYGKLEILN